MMYRSRRNRPNKDVVTSEDEIVFVLDLAGNFKFVNTAAERVSGYSREEACRMNVSQLVTPELGDYFSQQVREALKCDFGAVYEIEIISKAGQRVILETSTQLVMRNGEPFELRGIAFPAVETRDGEADVRHRCLAKEFVSML